MANPLCAKSDIRRQNLTRPTTSSGWKLLILQNMDVVIFKHAFHSQMDSFKWTRTTRARISNPVSGRRCDLIHHTQEALLAQFSLLCAERWHKTTFFSFHLLENLSWKIPKLHEKHNWSWNRRMCRSTVPVVVNLWGAGMPTMYIITG